MRRHDGVCWAYPAKNDGSAAYLLTHTHVMVDRPALLWVCERTELRPEEGA